MTKFPDQVKRRLSRSDNRAYWRSGIKQGVPQKAFWEGGHSDTAGFKKDALYVVPVGG